MHPGSTRDAGKASAATGGKASAASARKTATGGKASAARKKTTAAATGGRASVARKKTAAAATTMGGSASTRTRKTRGGGLPSEKEFKDSYTQLDNCLKSWNSSRGFGSVSEADIVLVRIAADFVMVNAAARFMGPKMDGTGLAPSPRDHLFACGVRPLVDAVKNFVSNEKINEIGNWKLELKKKLEIFAQIQGDKLCVADEQLQAQGRVELENEVQEGLINLRNWQQEQQRQREQQQQQQLREERPEKPGQVGKSDDEFSVLRGRLVQLEKNANESIRLNTQKTMIEYYVHEGLDGILKLSKNRSALFMNHLMSAIVCVAFLNRMEEHVSHQTINGTLPDKAYFQSLSAFRDLLDALYEISYEPKIRLSVKDCIDAFRNLVEIEEKIHTDRTNFVLEKAFGIVSDDVYKLERDVSVPSEKEKGKVKDAGWFASIVSYFRPKAAGGKAAGGARAKTTPPSKRRGTKK